MLTEDEVIDIMIDYLKNDGYEIESYCSTSQRGHDIVARKNDEYLCIEAKGQTSANPKSNRYGREFDSAQKNLLVKSIKLFLTS